MLRKFIYMSSDQVNFIITDLKSEISAIFGSDTKSFFRR